MTAYYVQQKQTTGENYVLLTCTSNVITIFKTHNYTRERKKDTRYNKFISQINVKITLGSQR